MLDGLGNRFALADQNIGFSEFGDDLFWVKTLLCHDLPPFVISLKHNILADRFPGGRSAEELPVADAIAALPDAKGYGTTYDLRQAMVRDEGLVLQGLVEEFVNCAERETRLDLVDRILMVWTGQEDGELTENKKNAILDSFFGTPTNGLWSLDPNRYEQHKATVFYQLMRQTHLSSFFANVTYVKDAKTNTWLGLYKHCVPVLARMVNEDPEGSADLVQDVVQAISGLNPYSVYRRMDAYWFLRLCNSH